METKKVTTRTGNPAWIKKAQQEKSKIDGNVYYFQLIKSYENITPRDKETNELSANPYPSIYWLANEGVALDSETGKQRKWRYIFGYPSIWEDEQTPTPSKNQIADAKNCIEFKKGILIVRGNNQSLLQAIMVQDSFEGNEIPLSNVPKVFRQLDETATLEKEGEGLDSEYEAMKFANESSISEMLPIAMALGIDISNSDEDMPQIKIKFKKAAKSNPTAFLKQTLNPKNQALYIFNKALQMGVISGSVKEHELVMVDTGVSLFPINSFKDISEQLAIMVMSNDEKANKLYEQLKRQL